MFVPRFVEAERKIKEAARQLDHLVRAVRIEELPRIKASYESKIKEDRENYEREVIEKAKQAKEQWTIDVKEKKELIECSVFDYSSVFESRIMAARNVVHDKLCKQEDERAEMEAEKGKLARARMVGFHICGVCVLFLLSVLMFVVLLPCTTYRGRKRKSVG